MAYADLDDYQVVTGRTVPEAEVPRVERALQSASDLFGLYLGDREAEIAAAYPTMLADLAVARAYRGLVVPLGIRSEAVGGSSVTYDPMQTGQFGLTGEEVRILAMMLAGGRTAGLRSVIMSSTGIVTVTSDEEDE